MAKGFIQTKGDELKTPLLLLTILIISGCRKDVPPAIHPYELNGVGLGINKDPDTGVVTKKLPSEMKGWVAFEPKELQGYADWCFNPPKK